MSSTTNNSATAGKKPTVASSNVRVLTHADTPKAALTLLGAFKDDALAKLLVCHFEDAQKRVDLELALYEAYINQHIAKGIVLGIGETEADFETVALWSTPSSVDEGLDSFLTLMESGYGHVWDIAGENGREKIFQKMLPLLHDTCERIFATDLRFNTKGVYTLVYVGSLDKARGKGNVRRMFEYMFQNHIDVPGTDSVAYLESSAKSNIPIYERFGFHFYEDIMMGSKANDRAVEGRDYAVMNVMIRGSFGEDWRNAENEFSGSSKL